VTSPSISGATVTLAGTLTLTDTLVATSPKIIIAAGGATLAGAGGRLELSNATTNPIIGATSAATLTNKDFLFGAGQLGDGSMVLDNAAGGIIDGSASNALTINTGASTINQRRDHRGGHQT